MTTLNVVVEDFHFEGYEDPNYYLKTLQYKNLFQVASDDFWLFGMNQFEGDSLRNKPVQIKISSKEKTDLDRPDKIISLFEISKNKTSYLSSKETLRENQGPISLITSIGFFGFAGFLMILLKKRL